MKKLYITTAIDYANGKPHIGHAYEKILTDTLVRMWRLQGRDVQFMTGLDEHGLKVSQSAEKAGVPPQIHCDRIAQDFKNLCKDLSVDYDRYIRTTEPEHGLVVRDCLRKLHDSGEIYRAEYTGLYSKTAERFVLEKDKINGEWPADYGEVIEISETNYFFKLSKYQRWLIDYIESHPDFIFPVFRRKQVLEFLKDPINDLCISRPKNRLQWGIELPFDSEYVTYVWFDALVNYISGANYFGEDFTNYWPADYHVIGKDIVVPAHAVYWPIMLHALGIALPKTLLSHGWWLISGAKMSKSSGNIVDPLELAGKFGADAFRYYLMREMAIGQDCDFSPDRFVTRYTCDLANDLGNLVSRLLNMGQRYCDGEIKLVRGAGQQEQNIRKLWEIAVPEIIDLYNEFSIHTALEKLFSCIGAVNVYIEGRSPWKLAKSDDDASKQLVDTTIATGAECLRLAAVLIAPVMPTISRRILAAIGHSGNINWGNDAKFGESLAGNKFGDNVILFPKIEEQ
ncbi:MAG: methionine--tRNA ligase [Puniceicoccales bacterium]|nr:methionine--tRNA ligase [Puniceicoccales bacterium]